METRRVCEKNTVLLGIWDRESMWINNLFSCLWNRHLNKFIDSDSIRIHFIGNWILASIALYSDYIILLFNWKDQYSQLDISYWIFVVSKLKKVQGGKPYIPGYISMETWCQYIYFKSFDSQTFKKLNAIILMMIECYDQNRLKFRKVRTTFLKRLIFR